MANAKDAGTFKVEIEYTDTFGGEANYCWVQRQVLELPIDASNLMVMRRAKRAIGINGMRGRSSSSGDSWEFRPYHCSTVMFVTCQQ